MIFHYCIVLHWRFILHDVDSLCLVLFLVHPAVFPDLSSVALAPPLPGTVFSSLELFWMPRFQSQTFHCIQLESNFNLSSTAYYTYITICHMVDGISSVFCCFSCTLIFSFSSWPASSLTQDSLAVAFVESVSISLSCSSIALSNALSPCDQ